MKSETELAATLIRHLQSRADNRVAHFHAEVKLPDGTSPDLVVHRPDLGVTAIYQCKLTLNEVLLQQCVASQDWADVVFAAVPSVPLKAIEVFKNQGVGIVSVGQHAISIMLPARSWPGHDEITKYLNDSNRVGGGFAAAGSRDERRATRPNIIAKAVEDYVAENPGCRFVDVRRAVPALSRAWGNFERCCRLGVYRVRIALDCKPAQLYPMEVHSHA